MPLQKLPPRGPLSVSASVSLRPQLQNRRRTLQTISELSTNDGGLPDFVSSIGIDSIRRMGHDSTPGMGRSTPPPAKRQSLPQHHPSQSMHAQCPQVAVAYAHSQGHLNPKPAQSRRPMPITADQVEGWNARRERARLRHELDIAEARAQQSASEQGIPRGSSISADRTSADSHHSSVRHAPSQQTLGKNNASSCSCGQVERRASIGSTINNTSQYDAQPAASERASTDSSSYQSRDSAINRSRSGSSNTSYTSQDAPPLPHGANSTMQGYSAELSLQNHNLVAFGESARSKNLNPRRSSRTLSLPTNDFKHTCSPHVYMTAPDLRHLPTQRSRPISAQRARNQALAALTAANSHIQASRHPRDVPGSSHKNRYASLTSHPPNVSVHRASLRSNASQHRLTSPSPTHVASTTLKPQPSQRGYSDAPRKVSFEARTVPKRESLTQWKREREEARASLQTDHKVRMQERVRRANEQELEREKELVQMGKRKGKGESGCFGGLFEAFKGRSKSK
ncbi:hypothetical protein SVAN01_00128 [Stagonosporopsis vannaccii]|nr:hypothetical protein SVAN01_00128 [Stagonosporopsis vannaccii]